MAVILHKESSTRWRVWMSLGFALLLCVSQISLVTGHTKQKQEQQDYDDDAFVQSEQFDEMFQEEPLPAEAVPSAEVDKTEGKSEEVEEEDPIVYATPRPPMSSYIAETFDDVVSFQKNWIKSQAKKDGVDAELAKYEGEWAIEESQTPLLKGDRSLVLKSKAKHSAISAALSRPYKFAAKPFVVQYEVALQEGQECGGGYIKLLSMNEGQENQLTQFQDRTPYTIMFGPDNCGNDFKLHFIFRHVNPISGHIEEKHAKRPTGKLDEYFKDKKPHLYTLVLRPDNSYQISIDHYVVNTGNLLEDMSPPVNPDKEIADPDDFRPEDWDDREKIADPDDKKPDDWDDDAPKKIPDMDASTPTGWLEDHPEMIADPDAVKPDDWDNDMDGEWEAPLINNPACEGAPGCGPWSRPNKDNPDYKGKWFPKQVTNPNYRGNWMARMIPNPHYFEDLEPFKMSPIRAVGFELWSMSENVLFDNIIITDDVDEARQFAADTYDLKIAKMERGKGNVLQRLIEYSNERPWLYAIYVVLAAVPVVLIIMCCCYTSSSARDADEAPTQADKKKTDAETADDEQQQQPQQKQQKQQKDDEEEEEDEEDEEDDDEDDEEEDGEDEEEDEEESSKKDDKSSSQEQELLNEEEREDKTEKTPARTSPRPRRRARKD